MLCQTSGLCLLRYGRGASAQLPHTAHAVSVPPLTTPPRMTLRSVRHPHSPPPHCSIPTFAWVGPHPPIVSCDNSLVSLGRQLWAAGVWPPCYPPPHRLLGARGRGIVRLASCSADHPPFTYYGAESGRLARYNPPMDIQQLQRRASANPSARAPGSFLPACARPHPNPSSGATLERACRAPLGHMPCHSFVFPALLPAIHGLNDVE